MSDHTIEPADSLTIGTIPDAALDRMIAATIPGDDPGVKPPAGTEADDWQPEGYRTVYGARRGVTGRPDISVQPTAIQLSDGSIDDGTVIEGPAVHVDGVSGIPLTVGQARTLAAGIIAAADSLAALSPDPAYPLDGVSFVGLLDAITQRVSGPGALRAAIEAVDPAALTRDDRAALLDLLRATYDAAGIE